MPEDVELRKKPRLKINLNKDGIEIIDDSDSKVSGIYTFDQIKIVEVNEERTNWFISTLSYVADLFMGSAVGGNFKDKANLKLVMNNQTLQIGLIGADFKKAKKVAESINRRINLP